MPDWKAMRGCKERKPQILGGEYSMFIVFYFYYNYVHVYSSTTSHQRTLNSGMKVQNKNLLNQKIPKNFGCKTDGTMISYEFQWSGAIIIHSRPPI